MTGYQSKEIKEDNVGAQFPRVILVMGPAGCGKSTLASALAKKLAYVFVEADDYHSEDAKHLMSQGIALTENDRAPWLFRLGRKLDELAPGPGTVMACSALKNTYRECLAIDERGGVIVFLEVSRTVLAQRLAQRSDHFAGPDLLESQLAILEHPQSALSLDGTLPLEQLCDQVIAQLPLAFRS